MLSAIAGVLTASPIDKPMRLLPSTPGYDGEMTVTHLLVAGRAVTPVVELEGNALRLPMTPALTVGPGRAGHALFAYLRGVMALPTVR